MLKITPDMLNWYLQLFSEFATVLLVMAIFLLFYNFFRARETPGQKSFTRYSVLPVLMIIVSMFLAAAPGYQGDVEHTKSELQEQTPIREISLVRIETNSAPFSTNYIKYLGVGKDNHGTMRYFQYTQYLDYGVYAAAGYDPNLGIDTTAPKATG